MTSDCTTWQTRCCARQMMELFWYANERERWRDGEEEKESGGSDYVVREGSKNK